MSADALGNPLEVGKCYGYSSTDGGWSTTTLGTYVRMGAKKATLKPIRRVDYLYGKPVDPISKPLPEHVSVSPHLLFPVTIESAQ